MQLSKYEQENRATGFFHYANQVIPLFLSPYDIVQYSTARKIFNKSPLSKLNIPFDEKTNIRTFQLGLNLSTFVYQYVFSTWFMYFFTTISGLRTLTNIFMRNPLFAIPFVLNFYIRMLGETDQKKIDLLMIFGMPKSGNFVFQKYMTNLTKYLGVDNKYNEEIEKIARNFAAGKIEGTIIGYTDIYEKDIPEMQLDTNVAYITSRDKIDFDDSMIFDYLEKLRKDPKFAKRLKKKTGKSMEIKMGEFIICLDKCKHRAKTGAGCLCSSECSSSYYGGREWCWVEQASCKRKLGTYFGYPFDYCDSKKITKNPKCFTGQKYKVCGNY